MNTQSILSSRLSKDICYSENRLVRESLMAILGDNYPIQALIGRLEQKVYKDSHTVWCLDGVGFLETYPVEFETTDGGESVFLTAKYNYRIL